MLTVIVARLDAPFVFDLREAVRDWTATGLLTGSVWIDAADVAEGALDTPCAVLTPGAEPQVASVRAVLGGHEQLRQVRLVSVQVAGDAAAQVDVDVVQTVRQQMAGSGVEVLRLNVVLPLTADAQPRSTPVMLATPNVVLQPADSANPSAPAVPLDAASPVFVAHCAGGLASVAGLWAGQDASPYDVDQMWVGGQAEMVRWFRRAVDGTTVWEGLRASVVPDVGPPAPVDGAGRTFDVAAPAEIPSQLQRTHDSLLAATASLTGPAVRQPFVPPPKQTIGLMRALKEFFAFLGTALRNAPARWLSARVDDVSRGVAARATAAIYGRDADVQVMFNGRVPERAGAVGEDIGALSSAAAGVANRLTGHLPVPPRVTEFADLFTYGSTALLDGGHRLDSAVALPTRGAAPVVVGHAGYVAPDPASPVFRVPPALGLAASDEAVSPWSPYTAIRVREQLAALEQQEVDTGGGRAGRLAEIQQARTRLDEWAGRQGAFTWNVQLTLARRLVTARQEFADAAEELRRDQGDSGFAELAAREASERRKVRWTLLFLPLVVVAIVLLAWLAPALIATVASVVIFFGWLATLVVRVLAAQRLAWQLMYARDLAAARRQWLAMQVELMAREVYRLGVAYGCAESWARVISGVVHRPCGVRSGGGAVAATAPGDTPREMQSATGHFDPPAMAEMVNLVRRSVLTPGWLGVELRRRVDEIAVRLQREAGYDHPRPTFEDSGVDATRELVATAVRVNGPAVEQSAGAQFDARIRAAIERVEQHRGGSWALASITVGAADGGGARGTGETRTAAEFLDALHASSGAGRLPELGFVGGGATDGAATVEAPLLIPTSGVAMSSLPGTAGGTVFDRGMVRLDRGRRCDPSTLGVAAATRGPAAVPTPSGGATTPRRDDDY